MVLQIHQRAQGGAHELLRNGRSRPRSGQPHPAARKRHRILRGSGEQSGPRCFRRSLGPQRGQGHRGCERVHASRTDPRRIPFSRPARPALFRQYRERNREEARHVPRLPDRILALRTGLDPARDREPADGLLHQPGIRERTAGRDLRLQPAADRQGPRIRHRRGLLRGRLGATDRSDHGIRSLAGVHLPPSAADVRPRARSREIRDDTQLRRCGRAVRRPDLDRTELLQPLPAGGYGCR